MRWIPGGEFTMGSDDPRSPSNERPAHRVRVSGFWMDERPVTNAEFQRFVDATGYVTTAEKAPDWDELKKQLPPDTPRPDASLLVAGSLVFVPPPGPVSLADPSAWWRWTAGAQWRHPEGPGSTLVGRDAHPVVHVSWDDSRAYAAWARKQLPTEAEWELAARGGLDGKRFAWGDEARPAGRHLANTFQGMFPHRPLAGDLFLRTSPVDAFPPNGHGLRDMAGNVWQWTQDWYRAGTFAERAGRGLADNPTGPSDSIDRESDAPRRVTKGGSFLCHESYCESYRPAARRGTDPDTGSSHVGFRLVWRT
jgi:formylglycine-generating enzyme required for sulfatase activity